MNNKKIPFATLQDEMKALQERSQFYEAKIIALHTGKKTGLDIASINKFEALNNQCQGAIAFCFAHGGNL